MPANSLTTIFNMAIGHCFISETVDDPDENSNVAIQCRKFFDQVKNMLLEVCPWPFATKRAPLVLTGTAYSGWQFSYKYPADCLLASYIVNPAVRTPAAGMRIPFRVVNDPVGYGKLIMTDMPEAELEYNILVEDVNLFNYTFIQALALGLAAHISGPLRCNADIVKSLQNQFSNWLAEAVNFKLREGQEDREPDSEFLAARSGAFSSLIQQTPGLPGLQGSGWEIS